MRHAVRRKDMFGAALEEGGREGKKKKTTPRKQRRNCELLNR